MSVDAASIREGDELPVLHVQPNLLQVIRFCGIIWNFPPFFYDEAAAKAAGMPGTIIPGPFKLGLIYRAVDEWLGEAGFIRQVRAAHRRPDQTNHPIDIVGRVARVYEEDGTKRADLEMTIVNERGEPSVRGLAVVQFWGAVELPS